MSPLALILIIFLLMIVVAPRWPYSRGWGLYPAGSLGVIIILIFVLMFAKVL